MKKFAKRETDTLPIREIHKPFLLSNILAMIANGTAEINAR